MFLSKFNHLNNFSKLKKIKNVRYLQEVVINGYLENIIERKDYPIEKCKKIINERQIGVIGYGPQGRCQSLNLRDNGFNVKIGLRKGKSWDLALEDGWVENKDLLSIEDACDCSDIIQYLLSDAGQIHCWKDVHSYLLENKTLYFSHGFGITYKEKTNIVPPYNIDVVLVAPKGAGNTVREKFLEGNGINFSYGIHQDFTGKAKETALALGFGIGGGHGFETTFEKETYSDLLGERCVLMGLIQGAFKAQYDILRRNGHSPIEAYNETVEEALVSLYPLINEKGMDWLYSNCSTTAQRGALDWAKRFEIELKPIIDECYRHVVIGSEAENSIKKNSLENYREELNKELDEINNQEIWKTAKIMRKYRV